MVLFVCLFVGVFLCVFCFPFSFAYAAIFLIPLSASDAGYPFDNKMYYTYG